MQPLVVPALRAYVTADARGVCTRQLQLFFTPEAPTLPSHQSFSKCVSWTVPHPPCRKCLRRPGKRCVACARPQREIFYFEVEAMFLGFLTVTIVIHSLTKPHHRNQNVVSGRVLVAGPGQCILWDYFDLARAQHTALLFGGGEQQYTMSSAVFGLPAKNEPGLVFTPYHYDARVERTVREFVLSKRIMP